MNLRNIKLKKINDIAIKYKIKKIYIGWTMNTIQFTQHLKNKYTEYEKENMMITENSTKILENVYDDIEKFEQAEFVRIIDNMYILIKLKKYNKFTTYCINDWNDDVKSKTIDIQK